MGVKQCEKCSEMVDEAKAFCPGCGNSFVIEAKRESVSNFDSFAGTVKLGDTMFNQMLTDMGLNISTPSNPPEKQVEVIAPVAAAAPTVTAPTPAVVAPPPTVSTSPPAVKPPENIAIEPKPKSNAKWFILGGVIIILFFLLILAVAVLAFLLWSRS